LTDAADCWDAYQTAVMFFSVTLGCRDDSQPKLAATAANPSKPVSVANGGGQYSRRRRCALLIAVLRWIGSGQLRGFPDVRIRDGMLDVVELNWNRWPQQLLHALPVLAGSRTFGVCIAAQP
jgi:hypothetical protein